MLARIAAETERDGRHARAGGVLDFYRTHRPTSAAEAIATVVEHALDTVPCDAVFVPTRTGTTARMLARFKPAVWVVSLSRQRKICQDLAFSYGVCPAEIDRDPDNQTSCRGSARQRVFTRLGSGLLVERLYVGEPQFPNRTRTRRRRSLDCRGPRPCRRTLLRLNANCGCSVVPADGDAGTPETARRLALRVITPQAASAGAQRIEFCFGQ